MKASTCFFNLFIALALALPVAALECHATYRQRQDAVAGRLSAITSEYGYTPTSLTPDRDLIDQVGLKLDRNLESPRADHPYEKVIRQVADRHGVSPALVKAVIRTESNFDPKAVSPTGAVGLMQILPATALRVGVRNPEDPHDNIVAGVRYLKSLLEMFNHDEPLAVAAYNSGPAMVLKYGGVPPIPQTEIFVARVMFYYRTYLKS